MMKSLSKAFMVNAFFLYITPNPKMADIPISKLRLSKNL